MIKPETEKKIIQVAEELVSEGVESPTNAEVLQRLGKGSLSTVSPVMREWRNRRADEKATLREMPDTLKELIAGSLSHLWAEANRQADKELEEFKEKARQEIRRAEGERDEAFIENGKLSKQTQTLTEKLQQGLASQKRLESQIKEKDNQILQTKTENSFLQKQVDDLKEQVSRLQNELVSLAKERAVTS